MPDYITIEHARAVVSHTSKLTENKYSEIVAAANDIEKRKLIKTAIGPRMADLKPDEVTVVDSDNNNQITQQELVDTFNRELTKNDGLALTQQQIDYLWSTSRVVIKDPGGSAAVTNSPVTVPSSPTVTNPPATKTVPPKPTQDTEAPTLSSSTPSNGASDIAKNSNIDLTFSENITLVDAAKVKLFKKSNNTEMSINTSVEGDKTLRIKPNADLEDSTEYYVKIESGAITDTSEKENAYAGITANTDLSFTTGTKALTSQEQAAANKAAVEKNNPVLTPGVTQLSSNSFNKPVTKLNLDADAEQSNGEQNLKKYINLRYGLDLLESKGDVHGVLGGSEQSLVDGTIQNLRNDEDTSFISGYQEDPSLYNNFILKQAIDDYQKIKPTVAATAKAAASKLNQVATMNSGEKQALIEVFEKYQTKFTNLENGISEAKLKKYLTDNYDTLKDLGIDNFPKTADKTTDITTINGKKKEELITLAVAARNQLTEKIYQEFERSTISAEDKKAFLKKYTDIDFSDSGKSIELIESLSDEELLILNQYSTATSFISRDFIVRELSQHKLSLQDTLGLSSSILNDGFVSEVDRISSLKKFIAIKSETDAEKKIEFINSLSPEELLILGDCDNYSGFTSKQKFLEAVNKEENKTKTLGEIFEITENDLGSNYLSAISSDDPGKILEKYDALDGESKDSLKNNGLFKDLSSSNTYTNSTNPSSLYEINGVYMLKSGNNFIKYNSINELLGLDHSTARDDNYFLKLTGSGFNDEDLLRMSENSRRLILESEPDEQDGKKTNQKNALHLILKKIYLDEARAKAAYGDTDDKAITWQPWMKHHVTQMLMAKDDTEFITRKDAFIKYLEKSTEGADAWFDIIGKNWNKADDKTERLAQDLRYILNNSQDTKATTSP